MSETQSQHGGANVRVPPPLIFIGLILVGLGLQRWVVALVVPVERWARLAVGIPFMLVGLWLPFRARAHFRRTGQSPAPWRPSPVLIAEGIYRYTRNPMYVGMTLFTLGLGAALGNPWIVELALVGLILVHYLAVRPEERYLAEKFGDSYLQYKRSVRRYL